LKERNLKNYLTGDDSLAESFYDQVKEPLYNYIYKRMRSYPIEIKQEVFQECLLKIISKRSFYRQEYPVFPWIYTVIRHTMIDYIRYNKKNKKIDRADYLIETESNHEEHDQDLGFMSELNLNEQKILFERFTMGKSFDELAHENHVTSQTMRKKVSRLINKIRVRKSLL
jgi:RNA polymerase sigma-70 factor (ECF subfamily)